MERTNHKGAEGCKYDNHDEPISLSPHLLNFLLRQPDGSNLYALYSFYYATAKWQETKQPKATNFYVGKGLFWGEGKVKKYKRQLIKLGLIENIVNKSSTGLFNGSYIRVHSIWSGKLTNNKPIWNSIHNPIRLEIDQADNRPPNALNNIYNPPIINDGENEIVFKRKEKEVKSPYLACARYLANIIKTTKNINITSQKITTWAKNIKLLSETDKVSVKRIHKVLAWYEDNIGGDYVPVVQCGASLREKFINLEDAIKRVEQPIKTNNQPKFKATQYRPPYKLDGTIRYYLNEEDGEYYHKSGTKYI